MVSDATWIVRARAENCADARAQQAAELVQKVALPMLQLPGKFPGLSATS